MAIRRCSFCGKRDLDVGHLIVGNRAAICDECVSVAAEAGRTILTAPGSLLVTGIGELATNDRGRGGLIGTITDAAVAIVDGTIRWVGPDDDVPARYRELDRLACGGRAALPGLVDAGAAIMFGGDHSGAYGAGQEGAVAAATLATPVPRLAEVAMQRSLRRLRMGVTTARAFVPPGLDAADSARLLDETSGLGGVELRPALPLRPDEATFESLLGETLTVCAPRADLVEIDAGAAPHLVGPLAKEAHRQGLKIGLTRADTELVATISPLTVTDPDPELGPLLASHRTVAVLTPQRPRSGRELWDAGALIALSTGRNPSEMYVESLALAAALAVRDHGLGVEEALWAATRGGALALDDDRRGMIGRGMAGDLVILDAPRVAALAHHAALQPWAVISDGHPVST